MTTFEPLERRQHTDLTDCQAELDALRSAFDSRPVIDQAKGILIAERGCTADEAFRMLSEASQRQNRKLRDIARAMVEGAQRDTEI